MYLKLLKDSSVPAGHSQADGGDGLHGHVLQGTPTAGRLCLKIEHLLFVPKGSCNYLLQILYQTWTDTCWRQVQCLPPPHRHQSQGTSSSLKRAEQKREYKSQFQNVQNNCSTSKTLSWWLARHQRWKRFYKQDSSPVSSSWLTW